MSEGNVRGPGPIPSVGDRSVSGRHGKETRQSSTRFTRARAEATHSRRSQLGPLGRRGDSECFDRNEDTQGRLRRQWRSSADDHSGRSPRSPGRRCRKAGGTKAPEDGKRRVQKPDSTPTEPDLPPERERSVSLFPGTALDGRHASRSLVELHSNGYSL